MDPGWWNGLAGADSAGKSQPADLEMERIQLNRLLQLVLAGPEEGNNNKIKKEQRC